MNIVTDTIAHLSHDSSANPASGAANAYPKPRSANRLTKNQFFFNANNKPIRSYNEMTRLGFHGRRPTVSPARRFSLAYCSSSATTTNASPASNSYWTSLNGINLIPKFSSAFPTFAPILTPIQTSSSRCCTNAMMSAKVTC